MLDTNLLKVFIIYASADAHFADPLITKLRGEEWIDLWSGKSKLLPGQEWKHEIEKALQEADVILICFSDESLTKEGYYQKEIKLALERAYEKPEGTIFIIPIRFNECEPPSSLSKLQWINCWGSVEEEYSKLLRSLENRLKSVHRIVATKQDLLIRDLLKKLRSWEGYSFKSSNMSFILSGFEALDGGELILCQTVLDEMLEKELLGHGQITDDFVALATSAQRMKVLSYIAATLSYPIPFPLDLYLEPKVVLLDNTPENIEKKDAIVNYSNQAYIEIDERIKKETQFIGEISLSENIEQATLQNLKRFNQVAVLLLSELMGQAFRSQQKEIAEKFEIIENVLVRK